MNYSIVSFKDSHSGLAVDFGKDGNQYYISIADVNQHTYHTETFVSHQDAIVQLHLMLDLVIDGCDFETCKNRMVCTK